MNPLTQFLRHHKEDPETAISSLFIAIGYHMSSEKEAIYKIMDYANQHIEREADRG